MKQIFKDSVEVTKTLAATAMYGGAWRAYQRKMVGNAHKKSIEYALWYGEKAEVTSGSEPRRTTGGVLEYLSTNTWNVNGQMTTPGWNTFRAQVARYGSDRMALFAGFNVISNIQNLMTNKLQISNLETEFGVKATRLIDTWGSVDIIPHPLFEKDYAGYAFLLDLSEISYVYLSGNGINRDTTLETNIQDETEDKFIDQYITECGLRLGLEKKHGYIYGVTAS